MSAIQINDGSTVIGELANDSGTLVLRPKNGAPVRIDDADGNVLFDSAKADTDWHYVGETGEPAFENGFSNYLSGARAVSYRKLPSGLVIMRGFLKTDGTPGQPAFTLPTGYRPGGIGNSLFTTMQDNNAGSGEVLINADSGRVTGTWIGTNSWIALYNVQFLAEQ